MSKIGGEGEEICDSETVKKEGFMEGRTKEREKEKVVYMYMHVYCIKK